VAQILRTEESSWPFQAEAGAADALVHVKVAVPMLLIE
jgi:hypothetical protein